MYSLLWREGSKKVEKSETESSVSMQGRRFYRQSFEERPLSGLEVIRQNIAAQIQIKTKCIVRQKQSHELSQEKQLVVSL